MNFYYSNKEKLPSSVEYKKPFSCPCGVIKIPVVFSLSFFQLGLSIRMIEYNFMLFFVTEKNNRWDLW